MPSLPVEYLVALGVLVLASLGTHAVVSMLPVSSEEERKKLRRLVLDRFYNLFLFFVLGWKISPLFFQWSTVAAQPAALIYLPGGLAGLGLGLAAALGYGAYGLTKGMYKVSQELHRPYRHAFISGGIGLLVLGLLAFVVTPALKDTGADAPGFSLPDQSAKEISLESLRGKPVVLNFWASWCPPCRAEFPELMAFASEGKAVVLGINAASTEPGPEAAQEFLKTQKVNFPVVYDSKGDVQGLYGVKSLPTTVVIDAQGRILDRRTGAVTSSYLSEILSR